MRKTIKKLAAVVGMATLMVGCFAGCGKSFDPSGYTKGILDARYYGQFDTLTQYVEEGTDEVEAQYNQLIDSTADMLLTGYTPDDEQKERAKDIAKRMMASVKYEVQDEEVKEGDNYKVTLKIQTVNMVPDMDALMEKSKKRGEEMAEEYMEEHGEDYDMNEFSELYNKEVINLILECYEELLANANYNEETTYEILVTKDAASKKYMLSDSEIQKLDLELINMTE